MYFLAKYEVSEQYGGPEEGGWWYDTGAPVWRFGIPLPVTENFAYRIVRWFNGRERKRRETENKYDYHSVLSHRDTFYDYHLDRWNWHPKPFPQVRPHYE